MIRNKDDRVEENGFMFSWPENEGESGPDEILSSFYPFILEKDLRGVKLIIAWSDSRRGQEKTLLLPHFGSICSFLKDLRKFTTNFLE